MKMFVGKIIPAKFDNQPDPMKHFGVMALELAKINLVRSITQIVFIICGYNILPKFVNQLIASSIQIDSRHLLSYYMPILLVYYYTGIFL